MAKQSLFSQFAGFKKKTEEKEVTNTTEEENEVAMLSEKSATKKTEEEQVTKKTEEEDVMEEKTKSIRKQKSTKDILNTTGLMASKPKLSLDEIAAEKSNWAKAAKPVSLKKGKRCHKTTRTGE